MSSASPSRLPQRSSCERRSLSDPASCASTIACRRADARTDARSRARVRAEACGDAGVRGRVCTLRRAAHLQNREREGRTGRPTV
eukprot:4272552-Pleurochrysis_carterae.AAC.3